MTPQAREPLPRILLGYLAVGTLNLLARLPVQPILAVGTLLLPLYIPFRFRTRVKLQTLKPPVDMFVYYRMRLRLVLFSIRHTLNRTDGCIVKVEGADSFQAALTSGKPVVLLGWHQGPVELLHKVPAEHMREEGKDSGRDFFLMTASAFSSTLSEWMTRKRVTGGMRVIRPGDTSSLRGWARGSNVLAVMIDQVPGEPEAWLSLHDGSIHVPWPARLMEWVATQNPLILAVSVRLAQENRIEFRYDSIRPESIREEIGRLMESAIRKAPEQYNWSYGKASVQRTADSDTKNKE